MIFGEAMNVKSIDKLQKRNIYSMAGLRSDL